MAPKIRTTKTHFAVQGYDAAACEGAYVFDTLSPMMINLQFIGALSNGVANTTVQAAWPIPQRLEVVKIWVSLQPDTAFSTTADKFNLVKGDGAESGKSGSGWATLGAGDAVFASDKAFGAASYTGTATNVYGPFYPDVMTAWWDTGDLMTLRIVTGVTANHIKANSISLSLLILPVDPTSGKIDAGSVTAPNF